MSREMQPGRLITDMWNLGSSAPSSTGCCGSSCVTQVQVNHLPPQRFWDWTVFLFRPLFPGWIMHLLSSLIEFLLKGIMATGGGRQASPRFPAPFRGSLAPNQVGAYLPAIAGWRPPTWCPVLELPERLLSRWSEVLFIVLSRIVC